MASLTPPALASRSVSAKASSHKAEAKDDVAESAGGHSNGVKAVSKVSFGELQELVRMVHTSDIVELELKSSGFEFALRKKEALQEAVVVAAAPQYATAPVAAPAAAPAPAPAAAAPVAAPPPPPAATPKKAGYTMVSPMAGTFYRSPAPGDPAFAKEGDVIRKGQPICIVEAMKLMNEIEAEVSGTIVEILIGDGKPIKIDQPLFLIATS